MRWLYSGYAPAGGPTTAERSDRHGHNQQSLGADQQSMARQHLTESLEVLEVTEVLEMRVP